MADTEYVQDPALLQQLNEGYVTDPAILEALNQPTTATEVLNDDDWDSILAAEAAKNGVGSTSDAPTTTTTTTVQV